MSAEVFSILLQFKKNIIIVLSFDIFINSLNYKFLITFYFENNCI